MPRWWFSLSVVSSLLIIFLWILTYFIYWFNLIQIFELAMGNERTYICQNVYTKLDDFRKWVTFLVARKSLIWRRGLSATVQKKLWVRFFVSYVSFYFTLFPIFVLNTYGSPWSSKKKGLICKGWEVGLS